MEDLFLENETVESDLGEYIIGKADQWREHYQANYQEKHQEYYRLWRAIWSEEDKVRESERSQLIAPAIQQAVESGVAEVEEATFSSGKIFDITDDFGDEEPQDVAILREKLHEDMDRAKIRTAMGECLLTAAVYGTAIGEVVLDTVKEYVPATQGIEGTDLQQIGVHEKESTLVRLKPIQPQNFLIDPVARCVDSAEGVIIDEFVSLYSVQQLQEDGVYSKDVLVGIDPPDDEIEPDPELATLPEERVRLTKYFGKVPTALLKEYDDTIETTSEWTEAIVVTCNGGDVLKAMANPYMCQDRPIVAFSWDVVPSRFWGRGVVEKGYMSQKALDAELRARIDALALTTHPMMAVDSDRVPRGTKFEIRPGKMFLTQGNPAEVLQPFKFGQVDQITFQQSASLQNMVQQATGSVDSAGMANGAAADGTLGGMAMSLGAVIKRQKRTLLNFQENFLKPFVKKAAVRYMQFEPDSYPVQDYKFTIHSSLGTVAREYEIGQLSQAVQTLPPGSPAHSAVMKGIIEHLSISNREEIIAMLEQASQPDPEAQQRAAEKEAKENAVLDSQIALLQAQAAESQARASKYMMEAELYPEELVAKYYDSNNDGLADPQFEQMMRKADFMLRKQDQELKAKQQAQQEGDKQKQAAEAELIRQLTGGS